MKKTVIATVMTGIAALTLVGCSSEPSEAPVSKPTTQSYKDVYEPKNAFETLIPAPETFFEGARIEVVDSPETGSFYQFLVHDANEQMFVAFTDTVSEVFSIVENENAYFWNAITIEGDYRIAVHYYPAIPGNPNNETDTILVQMEHITEEGESDG